MGGYDIFLSDGEMLTSIAEKTVDTRLASPLVLIGKGTPNFWDANDQNFAWMLEHFSASSPPMHPLVGQLWHDRAHGRMAFNNSKTWAPLLTPDALGDGLFHMLDSATNIDFTTSGITPIFTAPDGNHTYLPTLLLLVLNGSNTAATPAVINLNALTAGDVLSTVTVPLETDQQFVRLSANECCQIISTAPVPVAYGAGLYGDGTYSDQSGSAATIFLSVTTPATSGELHYDAYLFGLIIPYIHGAPIDVAVAETAEMRDTPIGRAVYPAGTNEPLAALDQSAGRGVYPASVVESGTAEDITSSPGYGEGLYGGDLYGENTD